MHALYHHPAWRGDDISSMRGVGLFISTEAFGDAAWRISVNITHAFRFFSNDLLNADEG